MTWEAVGVITVTIAVTLAAFATVVPGLAWLMWKWLSHSERQMRGDIRLTRRDKQAITGEESPQPWWG